MMVMIILILMMMSDDDDHDDDDDDDDEGDGEGEGDGDDAAQHGKCQRTITLAIVPEFLTPVQTLFFSLNMDCFFSHALWPYCFFLFRFIIQNGAQRCETTPFP